MQKMAIETMNKIRVPIPVPSSSKVIKSSFLFKLSALLFNCEFCGFKLLTVWFSYVESTLKAVISQIVTMTTRTSATARLDDSRYSYGGGSRSFKNENKC